MPVIPTYERKMSIPGSGATAYADVSTTGKVGEAISDLGNTIFNNSKKMDFLKLSGTGIEATNSNNVTNAASFDPNQEYIGADDIVVKIDNTYQAQKQENKCLAMINFDNMYSETTNAYMQNLSQCTGADAFGMTQTAESYLEKQKEAYVCNMPPELREQIAAICDERNNNNLNKCSVIEAQQRNVCRMQIVQSTTDLSSRQMTDNYNSPSDVNRIIAQHSAKLEYLGIPQDTILKTNASMISSAVQTAIDKEDVNSARILLNDHKDVLSAFDRYENLERQIVPVEKSVGIRNAYDEIYANANGDFKAMQEFIHNPKNQNSLGFDDDQKYYLVKKINDARIAHEKEIAAVQDKTATDVFTKIGTFNPYQIDTLVDRGSLSYKQGENFKQQIINGQPEVTNAHAFYGAYSKMLQAAGDSEAMMKVKGEIMFSPAISGSDKKKLIDVTGNTQSRSEALAIAKGMNHISSMLMPLNSSLGLPNSQADNDFVEAGKILIDEIADAKQRGEPINSETIGKMSREVAGHFSNSVNDYLVQNAVMNYSKQEINGNPFGINFTNAEINGKKTDKYDNIDDKYISKLNELIESSDTVKEIKDNYKKLREINEQIGKVSAEKVDLEIKYLKQGYLSEYENKRYYGDIDKEIGELKTQQSELGGNLASIAGKAIYNKLWKIILTGGR